MGWRARWGWLVRGILTKRLAAAVLGRRGRDDRRVRGAIALDSELRRDAVSWATGPSARPTPSAPSRASTSPCSTARDRGSAPGWSTAWAASSSETSAPGAATGSRRPGGKHRKTGRSPCCRAIRLPRPALYSGKHLHAGLNYVKMRDGISIAATVRLPPGKTLADGPFPTVIEYSGYATAAPHSLLDALAGQGARRATPCSPTPPPSWEASSPRCSDSSPSASRCAARGARAAPSTSSGCPRTTTATT